MAKNNPIHNNHCIKNKITVKAAIFINKKNKKLHGRDLNINNLIL
jgi:hypothetical protein